MELAIAIKGKVEGSLPASLRQASASMEELNRKAAQLKSIEGNTKVFVKTAQSVQQMRAQLETAKGALSSATAALFQTGGATRQAQKAYNMAEKDVRQLSSALADEEGKLARIREELQQAGFSTDKFADSQKRLQAAIAQNNGARSALSRRNAAKENQDVASQRLAAANVNLQGGINLAHTLTEPLFDAADAAIKFESAMADVRKVVDFDTPQQFKEMSDDVLQLSQRLPMAADDIAKIVAAGGQSGIAREDLMDFAESAVKMGIAFDVTADQAGDMMAKWRTAFKMNQSDVVDLADKINYLGNTTAASAPIISDIVTRVGPLGEVGGVASGEIAALGASMAGVGIPSEVAATGIKNLILGMTTGASATNTQKEAFQALGFSAEDMAKRMQTDAKGAILDVMKALQALPKEQQAGVLKDLFGQESINAIAPLLSNLDNLQDNFNKVGDASQYAGSMEQEYAARSQTTENQLQLAKNAVEALGISVGNLLLPYIQKALRVVTPFIERLSKWASENPNLVATLLLVAAGITGIVLAALGLAVIVSLAQWVAASLGVLQVALGGLSIVTRAATAAQAALNLIMSLNPVMIVVLAIMALIGALVYLYNTNETVRAAFDAAWNFIANEVAYVGGVIMEVIGAAGAWCANQWDYISSTASSAWDAIVATVEGVINDMEATLDEGVAWAEEKWNYLKGIFSSPITAVVNFIKGGDSSAQSAASEAGMSATGGVFTKPYLTWVAEAGDPEVIVPINRSARAMSLWQTAGKMLGVMPTDGTATLAEPLPPAITPVLEPRQTGGEAISLNFSPTINISGNADAGTVTDMRTALNEMRRQLVAELPGLLRDARANERRLSFA